MSSEIDPYCNYVTKQHYPNCIQHHDIRTTDFTLYRGLIDIVTGGFPCQPFSVAGEQQGTEDPRYLWPEMFRGIREIAPRWAVCENVYGLVSWNGGLVFDKVQTDLESIGYEVAKYVLPAAGVNAPHRRDRVWFVAFNAESGNGRFNKSGVGTTKRLEMVGDMLDKSRRVESSNRTESSSGDAADIGASANSNDKREGRGHSSLPKENGEVPEQYENAEPGNPDKQSDANPHSQGFPLTSQRKQRLFSEANGTPTWREPGRTHAKVTEWQNFPTQSPVCTGDDGLPAELVRQFIRDDSNGILSEKEIDTIISKAASKWRKEVIKMGGNAIVPQVAYQIFKTIESYETLVLNHPLIKTS